MSHRNPGVRPRRATSLLLPALLWLVPAAAPPVRADEPAAERQHEGGGGKKADEAALLLLGPAVLGLLFTFPVGLAAQCLILAHAPRRGLPLVHRLEAHRWKTLLLGLANTLFLGVVFLATQQHLKAIAVLALVLWWALAFVGCHGIARAIGARVLGHDPALPPGAPADLKALAVGWFVLVFASALPVIGPLVIGPYWCIRGAGGVILAVFSVPDAPEAPAV